MGFQGYNQQLEMCLSMAGACDCFLVVTLGTHLNLKNYPNFVLPLCYVYSEVLKEKLMDWSGPIIST